MRRVARPALLAMAVLMAGCSIAPRVPQPPAALPQRYAQAPAHALGPAPDLAHWWRSFHDPQLDALVQRALAQNLGIGEELPVEPRKRTVFVIDAPNARHPEAPLLIDPGSYLLDWCGFVFQSLPEAVQGVGTRVIPGADPGNEGPDHESFVARFAGGASAQISYGLYHRASWGDASRFLPPPGFQVYAERGVASLELPERIQWASGAGVHDERLPLEPTVGDVLNDHFHRLVRGQHALAPTIRDALTIARLVRDLRRSQLEGGAVVRTTV